MIATISTERTQEMNWNHRKENKFTQQITGVAIVPGVNGIPQVKEAVILRYYTTDSRTYACAWLHGSGDWLNGSGYAGGYGWHRRSGAAQAAFNAAGVTLSEDIGGRGDNVVDEAVQAITRALWPSAVAIYINRAHA